MSARISFIGAGRVGTTLARAMHAAGMTVVAVASRSRQQAEALAASIPGIVVTPTSQEAADAADLVFLTVSDDAIDAVCAAIAWRGGMSVVHCSGVTELEALRAAGDAGARIGAFHPLQMFANPDVALATLPGCTITIEADADLGEELDHISRRVGCRPLRLPHGRRALYHASAYYVGPFLIALMNEAVQMWGALGLSERDTLEALVPLLRGTVAAVVDGGLAQGMGGCVARGDVGTVTRHVDALGAFSPEIASLYRRLALRTIPLALARGTLSPPKAAEIQALLDGRT
jgi:predicted short-subunit dehydrogenase-like oxidoreductase (DUF2520 family)